MDVNVAPPVTRADSRTALLDAAIAVVRERGLTATRVEDVCAAAGVTKGSFFHHFRSKDELMLGAAAHWHARTTAFFAAGAYRQVDDARARLLAYVDFRIANLDAALEEVTCFAGTVVQEAWRTQPEVAAACAADILGHARALEADVKAALAASGQAHDWSARSLALHIVGAVQGAFVLAKAARDLGPARQSLQHLRRYLEHILAPPARTPRLRIR
jgi:TetR/AcrR family transcriptional repressor of nem operon